MLNDQQRAVIENLRTKETALNPKERAAIRVALFFGAPTLSEQADCARILAKTAAS